GRPASARRAVRGGFTGSWDETPGPRQARGAGARQRRCTVDEEAARRRDAEHRRERGRMRRADRQQRAGRRAVLHDHLAIVVAEAAGGRLALAEVPIARRFRCDGGRERREVHRDLADELRADAAAARAAGGARLIVARAAIAAVRALHGGGLRTVPREAGRVGAGTRIALVRAALTHARARTPRRAGAGRAAHGAASTDRTRLGIVAGEHD